VAIDPNVDSEYVGLSPLTLDDIRNFLIHILSHMLHIVKKKCIIL